MATVRDLLWETTRVAMLREEVRLADRCRAMGLDPSRPHEIQEQVRQRFGDDMELVRLVSAPYWSDGPDFTCRWDSRLVVQQRGPMMYAGPLPEFSDDDPALAPS